LTSQSKIKSLLFPDVCFVFLDLPLKWSKKDGFFWTKKWVGDITPPCKSISLNFKIAEIKHSRFNILELFVLCPTLVLFSLLHGFKIGGSLFEQQLFLIIKWHNLFFRKMLNISSSIDWLFNNNKSYLGRSLI
jgi:hypothetical protein